MTRHSAFAIEPATGDDLLACAQLGVPNVGISVDDFAVQLAACVDSPTRQLLVARRGDAVVGYGKVSRFTRPDDCAPRIAPSGWYLGGLAVAAAARRAGIGSALTRARMAWVADRAPEVWYFTNARNGASLDLHARLGFAEVTRDFEYPGVTFEGGVGVLCRAKIGSSRPRLDS